MKRFSSIRRLALVAVLSGLVAQQTAAEPPDILRNYRFIPSHSNVHVTGGFAGVDWDLAIAGRFGLVTGYGADVDGPHPTLQPYAQFVDVEAILYNPLSMAPMPVPAWDLNDTLNLSGLDGTFHVGEPNLLFFHGVDGQGQPIHLKAAMHGRLLRIVGANDPVNGPDGSVCSDCFGYEVDALAHLAPYADFNLDGAVDRSDAELLLSNIGIAADAAFEQGDADGDEDVDGDDLLVWQRELGAATSLSVFDDLASGSAAVPEPATLLLLFWIAVMPAIWRSRCS